MPPAAWRIDDRSPGTLGETLEHQLNLEKTAPYASVPPTKGITHEALTGFSQPVSLTPSTRPSRLPLRAAFGRP